MISRYIKSISLFLLVLIGYALSLLPLMLVWPHLQREPLIGAMAIWGLLALVTLPFVLRMIVRKVWFFKGRGEPVIQDLLMSMIEGINDFDSPVLAWKKKNKIVLNWRYDDPKWCERMALEGVRKTYELRLFFDGNTRTVTMVDRMRKVDFDLCPIKVKTGWLRSPRLYCRVWTGQEWGLQNFKNTSPEQYSYLPREMKSPVFNAVISHGWNVRFDLF